jgi:hypothetical protein
MAAMNDFPRKKSRSSLRETGWLERSWEASSTRQSAKTGKNQPKRRFPLPHGGKVPANILKIVTQGLARFHLP